MEFTTDSTSGSKLDNCRVFRSLITVQDNQILRDEKYTVVLASTGQSSV